MNPIVLGQRLRDAIVVTNCRRKTFGWGSAWTYLRWVEERFRIRVASRLFRPRVECPCCGWKGWDFLPLDVVRFLGPSNVCGGCEAQVRHRAVALYLRRHEPSLFEEAVSVLHFAPEPHVWRIFDSNERLAYFCTDLGPNYGEGAPGPLFRSDVTRMAVPDNSFDFIICFHVIEHIKDDQRAVDEILRMLKPGGVAYIMVPLSPELDASVHYDPPREDMFGHYWDYAPRDFVDRLSACQFEEIRPKDFLTPEELSYHKVFDRERIYRCVKERVPEAARVCAVTAG